MYTHVNNRSGPGQTATEVAGKEPGVNTTKQRVQEVTESFTITENSAGEGLGTITGVLARGNMLNRNRRYYPTSVLAAAATASATATAEGELVGLVDHPEWHEGDKGSPLKIAINWTNLSMDGDDLIGEGLIVDNHAGREVLGLKRAKVKLGLSTNGYASSRFVPIDELGEEVALADDDGIDYVQFVDELHLLTVDVVNDPSNVHARINRESVQAIREATMNKEEKKPVENDPKQEGTGTQEVHAVEALAARVKELEARNAELAKTARAAAAREALSGYVKLGTHAGVDLDAAFEARALAAAEAAEDDASAIEAVKVLVAERAAIMEGARASLPKGGKFDIPTPKETEASNEILDLRAGLGL